MAKIQTLDEIRNELVEKLNTIQDSVTGNFLSVDVNDATDILAVFVNCIALKINTLGEQLLKFRESLNPFKASDQELRDVIEYRGLTAKTGTPTTTTVIFTGDENTVIPEGTRLRNKDRTKEFTTDNTVVISNEGTATTTATCTEAGAIPLAENELTELVEPIYGVNQIENNNIELGTNDETDQEIHLRLENTTAASGYGFLDTLDSALSNIIGVKSATSYVGADISLGLNAGEICCVVRGGDDEEIAKTIFEKNFFALKTVGDVEVNVASAYLNREYAVKFKRPEEQAIKISIEILKMDNKPDNLDNLLLDATVYFLDNLNPSETYFESKYMSYINSLGVVNIISTTTTINESIYNYYKLPWNKIFHINSDDFIIEESE